MLLYYHSPAESLRADRVRIEVRAESLAFKGALKAHYGRIARWMEEKLFCDSE